MLVEVRKTYLKFNSMSVDCIGVGMEAIRGYILSIRPPSTSPRGESPVSWNVLYPYWGAFYSFS